jgi:hypothetical protein
MIALIFIKSVVAGWLAIQDISAPGTKPDGHLEGI